MIILVYHYGQIFKKYHYEIDSGFIKYICLVIGTDKYKFVRIKMVLYKQNKP